eukprot:scaffold6821_cov66-Phaeocystis_antarctica.AAC.4
MLKAASEEGACVHSEITSTRLLARHKRKSSRHASQKRETQTERQESRERSWRNPTLYCNRPNLAI